MSNLEDYPYYEVISKDLDLLSDGYQVFSNHDEASVQVRVDCPFCGGDKTLNMSLSSGKHTCWKATCHYKGGKFFVLYAALKDITWTEAGKLLRRKIPELTEGVKTSLDFLSDGAGWAFDETDDEENAIESMFGENTFERVTPDHPQWKSFSRWVGRTRSPSYSPSWFFDRFSVNYTDRFPYSQRAIFRIETEDIVGYLAYAMDKETMPKTLNPKGSILSRCLFNYNDLERDDWLFVCEGLFTAARPIRAGFDAVATFGTSVSYSQLDLLRRVKHKNIVFMYDYGAGAKAKKNARKLAEDSGGSTVYWAEIPFHDGDRGFDLDDIGTKRTKNYLHKCITNPDSNLNLESN